MTPYQHIPTLKFVEGAELNNGQCWRTDWRPAMDRYFIDLMLEQIRQGNMINQRFSKLAWSDIIVAFRAEFGPQHDEDALKKRFVDLRRQFNDMKNILGQSGFAWDETQQMIIANLDDLWDAYVKVGLLISPVNNIFKFLSGLHVYGTYRNAQMHGYIAAELSQITMTYS